EPHTRAPPDHLQRERPHRAVGDRQRDLQTAEEERRAHRDHRTTGPRAFAHHRPWLEGGRRHRARIRQAARVAVSLTGWFITPQVRMLRRPDDPDEPNAASANMNERDLATDGEINVSTTDSGAARELRLRLWAEPLACTEDDPRHTAPTAILDGRWVAAAHKQHCIVTRRS